MKHIAIFVGFAFSIFIGCKKSSQNQNPNPILNLSYAAKYTQLMGGSRVWHRYETAYTYNTTSFHFDNIIIYLSDTVAAISIINDTTISSPYFSDGIVLLSDTGNMLYFYGVDGFIGRHPTDIYSAYYFPANDSICIIDQGVQSAFDNTYYYHSP